MAPKFRKVSGLADDTSGAVAIYVSLLAGFLFGMVGLAVDASRLYSTNTEAKSAADAAALAAASQLDGTATAITRAVLAAQGSPLVSNKSDLTEGNPTITI